MRDDPVVITGFRATGTTMMAEIIRHMGIELGTFNDEQSQNLESDLAWEFCDRANNQQLRGEREEIPIAYFWNAYFPDVANKRWGIKHPQFSKVLKRWLEYFPNTQVIHMERLWTPAVAALPKAGKKDSFESAIVLSKETARLHVPPTQRLFVSYDTFVQNPLLGSREVASFLNIPLSVEFENWVVGYVFK